MKLSGLALASTQPFTSGSERAWSSAAANCAEKALESTLTGLSGVSKVITATPSVRRS